MDKKGGKIFCRTKKVINSMKKALLWDNMNVIVMEELKREH